MLTPYLNWAYLLDPLHELYREGDSDLVEMLSDFAPDDFRQSDYFKRFSNSRNFRLESFSMNFGLTYFF